MAGKNVLPTYKRQRFLLSFISQLQDEVAPTNLQKNIFIYNMSEKSDFYEFVPYKFGPYSFQLREDVDILRKNGFLIRENFGIAASKEYQGAITFPIATERGDELIRRTYREYPYYAINSEIIPRLFHNDPLTPERIRHEKQQYVQTEQMLFTIGYEGRSLEAFMNTLVKNDVHLLCDVRKNPFSRKFGFTKDRLEQTTKVMGIKYLHFPALGIESAKRKFLDTEADYISLFDDYKETLPYHKKQLDSLYEQLCSHVRIALMCFEKEPEMCHRHVIRDYLCDRYPIRSMDL